MLSPCLHRIRGEQMLSSLPSLCKGGCRAKRGGRVVRNWYRAHSTTPPSGSFLACHRLGGARERCLSHGFCPQWQKPQFAARARHTVAMRIMRGSPPYTGEASPPYTGEAIIGKFLIIGTSLPEGGKKMRVNKTQSEKKRKYPGGFPSGHFLAIGLSINQTVVNE